MTSPATVPSTPARVEATHPCLRCGRPVPIADSLCELCNPLGLKQPAATQVHALAAGGIVLFVVLLAALARVGLSGVGPFEGAVTGVAAQPAGLGVTISVSNDGSKGAATTCRVVEADRPVGGPGQIVQTPIVPAGESITFTATVTAFGAAAMDLAVDCQSP